MLIKLLTRFTSTRLDCWIGTESSRGSSWLRIPLRAFETSRTFPEYQYSRQPFKLPLQSFLEFNLIMNLFHSVAQLETNYYRIHKWITIPYNIQLSNLEMSAALLNKYQRTSPKLGRACTMMYHHEVASIINTLKSALFVFPVKSSLNDTNS